MLIPLASLFSGHETNREIAQWGYWLVGAGAALQSAGVPLPGTTAIVVVAIYAAATHRLGVPGIVTAGALGATVGSAIGYGIGRWGGWALLHRHGHRVKLTPERLRIGTYVYSQHGPKVVFFGRFITGLRTFGGFLAGTNRMPPAPFMIFNALGATTWATINGVGYYYFGHVLTSASTAVSVVFVLVFIGLLAATMVLMRRRGRSLRLEAERFYAAAIAPE